MDCALGRHLDRSRSRRSVGALDNIFPSGDRLWNRRLRSSIVHCSPSGVDLLWLVDAAIGIGDFSDKP